MILFGACVYNILRRGTLEILQLCHLGICMYTMETREGLAEYQYTLHIEEVYNYSSTGKASQNVKKT